MQPLHHRPMSAAVDPLPAGAPCEAGQGLLLWALRIWAAGRREEEDALPDVRAAFEARGIGEAFVALRELLFIAGQSASRSLDLAAPGAVRRSADERCLQNAIRHAGGGDLDACRRCLAMLLCPLGARTALLPAWCLARALAGLASAGPADVPERRLSLVGAPAR